MMTPEGKLDADGPMMSDGSQDASDSERLKQIADRLQEIGSDDAEPRATKILRGTTRTTVMSWLNLEHLEL